LASAIEMVAFNILVVFIQENPFVPSMTCFIWQNFEAEFVPSMTCFMWQNFEAE
jgi:hypothetical protein